MTAQQDRAAATDRLRRALLAFQAALNLLLGAERRLKGLPQADSESRVRYTTGPHQS